MTETPVSYNHPEYAGRNVAACTRDSLGVWHRVIMGRPIVCLMTHPGDTDPMIKVELPIAVPATPTTPATPVVETPTVPVVPALITAVLDLVPGVLTPRRLHLSALLTRLLAAGDDHRFAEYARAYTYETKFTDPDIKTDGDWIVFAAALEHTIDTCDEVDCSPGRSAVAAVLAARSLNLVVTT